MGAPPVEVVEIVEVAVADDAAAWRAVGFAVDDDGTVLVGRTRIRLTGRTADGGITGWTLRGVAAPAGDAVDGLPTAVAGPVGVRDGPERPTRVGGHPRDAATAATGGGDADAGDDDRRHSRGHPNGCTRIDHVVVVTPDLDRTTAALESAGMVARRTREAGGGRRQRFFRLGEVILELVGPGEPHGDGPAAFWGLAYEVTDLGATAALLGDRLTRPRDAVQPGRQIAALRPAAGLSVATAFLSPEPRRAADR